MKILLNVITFIIVFGTACLAQTKETKPSKIFLSVGQGAAGSFFVRSYDEALPSSTLGYKAFYKKNFIGTAQEIAIGIHLKKNIDLKFGYNRQRFTRHVYVNDTLPSRVGVLLDHNIQHVDNIWFGGMAKNYVKKKSQFSWGAGLFYIRPQQQEVEIFSNYIVDKERNQRNSRLNDLGTYAELAYEYQFQPKVNIGVKGQFFWILSGSYANSIALSPFIKLNF